MIIKHLQDVPFAPTSGYEGVTKQVVIGPDDGSDEIVLRYFRLAPGGSSPHHAHDWPHLVKVEVGAGVAADADGDRTPVQAGDYVYVPDGEIHHFEAIDAPSFEFFCIVPRRGEF